MLCLKIIRHKNDDGSDSNVGSHEDTYLTIYILCKHYLYVRVFCFIVALSLHLSFGYFFLAVLLSATIYLGQVDDKIDKRFAQ